MQSVQISIERYDQLIRAERDAEAIKSIITSKADLMLHMTSDEVRVLYKVFCEERDGQ